MTGETDLDVETARLWWGLARYDPEAVDVEDLLATLDPGDDRGSTRATPPQVLAAEALAEAAPSDPDPIVANLADLSSLLGHEAVGEPVAHAIGAAGAVQDRPRECLGNRLGSAEGSELHHAVAGLDRTAELAPERVRPLTDALFEVAMAATPTNRRGVARSLLDAVVPGEDSPPTDEPRALRDATTTALGRAATRDPALRTTLRESVTTRDPARRACAALGVGIAVRVGCRPLRDASEDLVLLLDDDAETVRRAAMRGLVAAAEPYPDAAAGNGDLVLACRGGDTLDDAATTLLTRVVRADRSAFEWLLDWVGDGGASGGILTRLRYEAPDRRAAEAVADGVAAHPGRFAADERALAGLFEIHPGAAARAVRTAARAVPGELDHAVEPLLDHTDARNRHRVRNANATFDAMATLSRGQPAIPRRLVRRLFDQAGARLDVTTRACAAVAAVAPDRLLSPVTVGDEELRAPSMLQERFRNRPKPGVTRTLARLGRADPSVVEPIAGAVEEALEEVRPNRRPALYELAGTVARVDPGAVEAAGTALVEDFRQWADGESSGSPSAFARPAPPVSDAGVGLRNRTGMEASNRAEEAVPFLAGLAVGRSALADELVGLLDHDPLREPVLAAVVAAATDVPGRFRGHADRLVTATDARDPGVRRKATRSLALLAGDGPEWGESVTDHLTDLAYDRDRTVRRWAAFALGELDDPGAEALDRLERVADHDGDEAAPAATLALVRGDHRGRRETLDALGTVADEADVPMATAAVEELAGTNPGEAEVLREVLPEVEDPDLRERVRDVLAEAGEGTVVDGYGGSTSNARRIDFGGGNG